MLAPIGELVDWLTKLDEPTKEMIVNFTASSNGRGCALGSVHPH